MDDDLIVRISALEHYMYCPRQCGLIDVEGQWLDNRHTVRGHVAHRRADSGEHRVERGRVVLRSIPLWSERYALNGRADVVELVDGAFVPVEYKSGTRHGRSADVQLCAQALCLEEMFGCEVRSGSLWFGGPRRRESVIIDEELRSITVTAIEEIRAMLISGRLPDAPADQRCAECQLEPRCLPTVVSNSKRAAELALAIVSPT